MKYLFLILALAGCAAPKTAYYVPGDNVSHEDVVVGTEGNYFIVAYWENDGWRHRKMRGNLK